MMVSPARWRTSRRAAVRVPAIATRICSPRSAAVRRSSSAIVLRVAKEPRQTAQIEDDLARLADARSAARTRAPQPTSASGAVPSAAYRAPNTCHATADERDAPIVTVPSMRLRGDTTRARIVRCPARRRLRSDVPAHVERPVNETVSPPALRASGSDVSSTHAVSLPSIARCTRSQVVNGSCLERAKTSRRPDRSPPPQSRRPAARGSTP